MTSSSPAMIALAPETLPSWVTEHQDLVVIDVRSAAELESCISEAPTLLSGTPTSWPPGWEPASC